MDWPTPSTLLPDGYHSELDALSNGIRYSNPAVDEELERIEKIGDAKQKAAALIDLEQVVMKDAPVVPFLYPHVSQVRGENIGGAFIHPIYGSISAAWLYRADS